MCNFSFISRYSQKKFINLQTNRQIGMNQDIHKQVERYEAETGYHLIDCYKKMQQRSNFDLSSYVCTDFDCLQFAKEENTHCWHYIQRVNNEPFHKVVSGSVDLNDYKEAQIERCITPFGYKIVGDSRFVDINKEEGYDWQQLCCECLFEGMISELLS